MLTLYRNETTEAVSTSQEWISQKDLKKEVHSYKVQKKVKNESTASECGVRNQKSYLGKGTDWKGTRAGLLGGTD